MKTIYVLLFTIGLTWGHYTILKAQDDDDPPINDQLKAMQIGFISQKLSLTEAQAQQFWPIFNTFFAEKQVLVRKIKRINKLNVNMLSDEQAKAQIQEHHTLKASEIELDKKYQDKFLKVISWKQLLQLYQAEHEFRKMLLQELRNRRHGK